MAAFETELEHEYALQQSAAAFRKESVLERYANISTKFNGEHSAREGAADTVASNIKVDTLKRLLKITELEDSTSKLAGAMTGAGARGAAPSCGRSCGSTRTCRWTTTATGAWAGRTRCWSSATRGCLGGAAYVIEKRRRWRGGVLQGRLIYISCCSC